MTDRYEIISVLKLSSRSAVRADRAERVVWAERAVKAERAMRAEKCGKVRRNPLNCTPKSRH